jgi:hypothetical protein
MNYADPTEFYSEGGRSVSKHRRLSSINLGGGTIKEDAELVCYKNDEGLLSATMGCALTGIRGLNVKSVNSHIDAMTSESPSICIHKNFIKDCWPDLNPSMEWASKGSVQSCLQKHKNNPPERKKCFGGSQSGWNKCFSNIKFMNAGEATEPNPCGTETNGGGPYQWILRCKDCHYGEVSGVQFQMQVSARFSSVLSTFNSLDWLYTSVFSDFKAQWRWEANIAHFDATKFPDITLIGGVICTWAVAHGFKFKNILCPSIPTKCFFLGPLPVCVTPALSMAVGAEITGSAPLNNVAEGGRGELSIGKTYRRTAEFGIVFCRQQNHDAPTHGNGIYNFGPVRQNGKSLMDGGKCSQRGLRVISKFDRSTGQEAGGDVEDGLRMQFKSQADVEFRLYLKIKIDIVLYCFLPVLTIELRLFNGLMIGAPASYLSQGEQLGFMVVKLRKVVNIEATWPYLELEVGEAGQTHLWAGRGGVKLNKPKWTKRAPLLPVDGQKFYESANIPCWSSPNAPVSPRFCGIDYETNNMNECVGFAHNGDEGGDTHTSSTNPSNPNTYCKDSPFSVNDMMFRFGPMTQKQMGNMRVKLTLRDMYHTSLGSGMDFERARSSDIEGQFIGQTSFSPKYDFIGVQSKQKDCWKFGSSRYKDGCCTNIGDACRVGELNNQYSTACEAGSERYERPHSYRSWQCIDGWSSEGTLGSGYDGKNGEGYNADGRLQNQCNHPKFCTLIEPNLKCTGVFFESCLTTDSESVTGQYSNEGIWTEAPSEGQHPRILYDVYFETPKVNNKPIRDNANDANPATDKTRFPKMADPYTERTGLVRFTDADYMPCGRDDSAYFGEDVAGSMNYEGYPGRIQSYFGADISFALGSATLPFAVGEYTPSVVINSHPYIY